MKQIIFFAFKMLKKLPLVAKFLFTVSSYVNQF